MAESDFQPGFRPQCHAQATLLLDIQEILEVQHKLVAEKVQQCVAKFTKQVEHHACQEITASSVQLTQTTRSIAVQTSASACQQNEARLEQPPNIAQHFDSSHLTCAPSRGLSALSGMTLQSKHIAGLEEFVLEHDRLARIKQWMWSRLTTLEADHSSKLAAFVHSKFFEASIAIIILLSTASAVLEANFQSEHKSYDTTPSMQIAEQFFTWAFFVEVVLKVLVFRRDFFLGEELAWNIFDLVLVILGLVDFIMARSSSSGIGNTSFMRLARLLKVVKKITRLVRLLHAFADLRLILECISGVAQPLVWSVILLLGFMLIFSIALVHQMTAYVIENENQLSDEDMEAINAKFGSVQQGVFELLSCTTGGHDWGVAYEIVQKAGPLACASFLAYIGLVGLAVTNVITSIFVDKALRAAVPEVHKQIIEKRRDDFNLMCELQDLFCEIDLDTSHTISKAELMTSLSHIKVASYFELKGLDIKDAETFYDVLVASCGHYEIDMDTFIQGFLCMKGPANHVDVVSLTSRIQKMQTHLNDQLCQLKQQIAGQFEECRQVISSTSSRKDERVDSTCHKQSIL